MALLEGDLGAHLLTPPPLGETGSSLVLTPFAKEPEETGGPTQTDETQVDVAEDLEPAPQPSPSELLASAIANDSIPDVCHLLVSGMCDVAEAPAKGRYRGLLPVAIAAKGSRSVDLLHLVLKESSARCTPVIGLGEALHGWALSFVDGQNHHEVLRMKLKLLIDFGVDVNMRLDHSGETALHVVARGFDRHRKLSTGPERNLWTQRRFESARLKFGLLLHARADLSIRNRNHETPLDLVEPNFHNELPVPQDCLAAL